MIYLLAMMPPSVHSCQIQRMNGTRATRCPGAARHQLTGPPGLAGVAPLNTMKKKKIFDIFDIELGEYL
jgi:hypothetical protein